jgi:hypothetical protein
MSNTATTALMPTLIGLAGCVLVFLMFALARPSILGE